MATHPPRKYRSDVEIMWEIIQAVVMAGDRGIKKTHLMYRTNLNSKMLARYLGILLKAGVVEEHERRRERIVRIGPRGLIAYSSLANLNKVLIEANRTEEEKFVAEQLSRLIEKGWRVEWDHAVTGRTGIPILIDCLLSKGGKQALVKLSIGRTEYEVKIALLTLYPAVADTNVLALLVTDLAEVATEALSPVLKDHIRVVSAKPLEGVIDRVLMVLES